MYATKELKKCLTSISINYYLPPLQIYISTLIIKHVYIFVWIFQQLLCEFFIDAALCRISLLHLLHNKLKLSLFTHKSPYSLAFAPTFFASEICSALSAYSALLTATSRKLNLPTINSEWTFFSVRTSACGWLTQKEGGPLNTIKYIKCEFWVSRASEYAFYLASVVPLFFFFFVSVIVFTIFAVSEEKFHQPFNHIRWGSSGRKGGQVRSFDLVILFNLYALIWNNDFYLRVLHVNFWCCWICLWACSVVVFLANSSNT